MAFLRAAGRSTPCENPDRKSRRRASHPDTDIFFYHYFFFNMCMFVGVFVPIMQHTRGISGLFVVPKKPLGAQVKPLANCHVCEVRCGVSEVELTAFFPCIRQVLQVLHSMHCHRNLFTFEVNSGENFRHDGWPRGTREGEGERERVRRLGYRNWRCSRIKEVIILYDFSQQG